MQTIKTIYKRKSTRRFSERKIDNAVLREILLAGLQAPSPKNDQPWHFLVVEQEEKRYRVADILEEQLETVNRESSIQGIIRKDVLGAFESGRVMREAPVLVFVYLDLEKCKGHDDNVRWELNARDFECTHIMAVGAAIQNILLAAEEKGIDSLWMGDIFYAYNKLHEYLGMDDCLMSAIALGYGIGDLKKTARKEYGESVSCFLG